jgi:hypothetical protein
VTNIVNNRQLHFETASLQFENNILFEHYSSIITETTSCAVIETSGKLEQQKNLKFHALIPGRVTSATDNDLRLSLISLKNAQSAIGVHVSRIEHELEHRHVSKYIIHQGRDT